jgi:hypothetical protein
MVRVRGESMAESPPIAIQQRGPDRPLAVVVRAPVFLVGLAASMVCVFFIFAWVTVGAWCEDGLRALGYRNQPRWLPAILGILAYAGLGIVGSAFLGNWLFGWPGGVLVPLAILALIAKLGRW